MVMLGVALADTVCERVAMAVVDAVVVRVVPSGAVIVAAADTVQLGDVLYATTAETRRMQKLLLSTNSTFPVASTTMPAG